MVYLPSVNTYLHQSSLLISAYPDTVRITTKYTLPRKTQPPDRTPPPNRISKTKTPKAQKESRPPAAAKDGETPTGTEKREPKPKPATLTFKTYEPGSGICLKYVTDKQAEVGRLMLGLGKLAAGEIIEEPTAAASAQPGSTTAVVAAAAAAAVEDKMDIDGQSTLKTAQQGSVGKTTTVTPSQQPAAGGGGGAGKKKKKGKK